jgi:hypothetical protein
VSSPSGKTESIFGISGFQNIRTYFSVRKIESTMKIFGLATNNFAEMIFAVIAVGLIFWINV